MFIVHTAATSVVLFYVSFYLFLFFIKLKHLYWTHFSLKSLLNISV